MYFRVEERRVKKERKKKRKHGTESSEACPSEVKKAKANFTEMSSEINSSQVKDGEETVNVEEVTVSDKKSKKHKKKHKKNIDESSTTDKPLHTDSTQLNGDVGDGQGPTADIGGEQSHTSPPAKKKKKHKKD